VIEKEFKLRVEVPIRDLYEVLRKIRAEPVTHVVEIDTYFQHPCRDFRESDEALRLRLRFSDGELKAVLTYKGPKKLDGVVKSREEIEVEASDYSSLVELLKRLGFTEVSTFTKIRDVYSVEGARVYVDRLCGVGLFIEVEGGSELSRYLDLFKEIGEPVTETYLEICLNTGRCRRIDPNDEEACLGFDVSGN